MKRMKESGAAFRKKKKAKEEEVKKRDGAPLKYISLETTTAIPTATPTVAEAIFKFKLPSEANDSSTSITGKGRKKNSNLKNK